MDSSLYVPVSNIKAATTTPYNCVQEVAHYIDLVYKCWSSICGAHPGAVTIPTVRRLEGRYPRLSSQDVSYITKSFNDFDVFETVQDKQKRSEMLSAVLRWPGRILSLRLLIEDTKILEAAAPMMRFLLPEHHGESIKISMQSCFQVLDPVFSQVGQTESGFDAAYRRLWLRAWKDFPEMSRDTSQKSLKYSKSKNLRGCSQTLSEFAIFARNEGFENAEISRLANYPWAKKSISEFLQRFARDGDYTISSMEAAVEGIEPILDSFCQAIIRKQHCPPIMTHHLLVTGDEQRCGMPSENSFTEDRHSLQPRYIYPQSWAGQTIQSKYVSSFSIIRDQFRSFFGDESTLSVEASSGAHIVAGDTYGSDGSNIFCDQDDITDVSVSSDASVDMFSDAHEF